jgi:hypothetical protein
MVDSIKPIIGHIKPEYKRKAIGVDVLTVTPTDKYGNTYLFVMVVHFTKLTWGYPSPTKDAASLAKALTIFFSLYGMFDTIISDPGSDLTSNLSVELEKFYGTSTCCPEIVYMLNFSQKCNFLYFIFGLS